jgi:hypothetical protein
MRKLIPTILAVSFAFISMAAPDWNEILGPSRAEIPLPLDKVV